MRRRVAGRGKPRVQRGQVRRRHSLGLDQRQHVGQQAQVPRGCVHRRDHRVHARPPDHREGNRAGDAERDPRRAGVEGEAGGQRREVGERQAAGDHARPGPGQQERLRAPTRQTCRVEPRRDAVAGQRELLAQIHAAAQFRHRRLTRANRRRLRGRQQPVGQRLFPGVEPGRRQQLEERSVTEQIEVGGVGVVWRRVCLARGTRAAPAVLDTREPSLVDVHRTPCAVQRRQHAVVDDGEPQRTRLRGPPATSPTRARPRRRPTRWPPPARPCRAGRRPAGRAAGPAPIRRPGGRSAASRRPRPGSGRTSVIGGPLYPLRGPFHSLSSRLRAFAPSCLWGWEARPSGIQPISPRHRGQRLSLLAPGVALARQWPFARREDLMAIAVLYEHPEWFKPLFATLERRGLPWVPVDAASLAWDPTLHPGFDLLVNRMSPSAWTRGHGHAIQSTLAYLHYVQRWGIPVVNGLDAWRLEISKSAQLDLFERLGVPYPRARVINHASQAPAAARGLRFPIVVKPNIGGSGAGIQRFDALDELQRAVAGRHGRARDGRHRAGPGVSARRRRPHHPARNPAARAALRHPHHAAQGPRLQPVPGRHLPGRRNQWWRGG